jgi:UDP-hydrolysing UDP-N-acetyl-D-glucosamine 2-epimerase
LVEADAAAVGVEVERIDMLLGADSPQAVGKSMGIGIASFAQSFAARPPDIVLVLGDRFEMFTAVAAAIPFVLPVAHIHGGERTAGAIDDALRHAMTKMSHVHMVSTREYGLRVRQLGEDAWRVVVSGAPAIDELTRLTPRGVDEVSRRVGFDIAREYVLTSFHPTTLEPDAASEQGTAVLDALARVGLPTLFMMPNADPGGRALRELIRERCAAIPTWCAVENLEFEVYVEVLRRATVLVGNSSSGIIEAPSLGVPVVNVGSRQEGRMRAANVIDVECDDRAIAKAVARAVSPPFRAGLRGLVNPRGGCDPDQTTILTSARWASA